jgi:hypothetical protein
MFDQDVDERSESSICILSLSSPLSSPEEQGLIFWRYLSLWQQNKLFRPEEFSLQIKAIHCASVVKYTPAPFY